jgi:glycosyltransferase involved in cell wall biosynthesis
MIKVVYVYPGQAGQAIWLTSHQQVARSVEWIPVAIEHEGSAARVWHTLQAMGDTPKDADLIVSGEYYVAVGVNAWLRTSGRRTPHIIWGLNQSRRLLTQPLLHQVANHLFARSNLVVTHSRAESHQFQQIHRIQAEKFRFVRWGFDLPAVEAAPFSGPEPYVCLVGRNNRDIDTFAQACQQAGIRGEVISAPLPPEQVSRLASMGVTAQANLSFERCLACLRDSLFSAVLLKDDSRGAGHITMVAAMLLGKAQVVSDAQVIADYVNAPEHALKVPMNDVNSCARAFQQLATNAALRQQMERQAQDHARRHCTNDAVADAFLTLAREATQIKTI